MLVKDPVRAGEERLKVLDFGIAKLTVNTPPESGVSTDKTQMQTLVGSMMGTPRFMAPEQWGQAESVDGRADVFALGVTLYALLAGKHPYEGSSMSLLTRQPVPIAKAAPKSPPRLAMLVDRMIQVTAAQRPAMAEVVTELARLAPRRFRGRELLIPVLLVGVVLGALLLFGVRVLHTHYSKPDAAELRERALRVIKEALTDKDPALRERAVHVLGQSGDPAYRQLLETSLKDTSTEVVVEAAQALGRTGDVLSRDALRNVLESSDIRARIAAASSLAQLHVPVGLDTLRQIAEQHSGKESIEAALLLAERGELKGAERLWTPIANRATLDPSLLKAVLKLADARFQPALERLRVERERAQTSDDRCEIAFHLAKAGDEDARQFLRSRLSSGSLESAPLNKSLERLLAAKLLAELREPIPTATFQEFLRPDADEDTIKTALAGLAYGGKAALDVLGDYLQKPKLGASLRLATAASVLRLLDDMPESLETQSGSLVRAALQSDSVTTRLSAVALYDAWEADQAIAGLILAQSDKEILIRERAVRAIGRKETRQALLALATTLRDPDAGVRIASIEAIRSVVEALRKRGDVAMEQQVRDQLLILTASPDETDRVAASGLLALLGDGSRSDVLVAGVKSKDPRTRRLAIEFVDAHAPSSVFVPLLTDSDLSVRLAAARRLAALGEERGLSLLRSTVVSGDTDGLEAFVYLRKLNQAASPPPDLSELLKSGELPTRFAIVDLILELSVGEATPLLKLACQDPAAVVRGRAARVAWEFYRRTSQMVFLDMVRLLRGDPEAYVRAQAAKLLKLLDQTAAAQQPSAAPGGDAQTSPHVSSNSVPSNGAADMSVALPTTGSLSVKAEDGIRFYVDADPKKYEVSNRQPVVLPLTVGPHSVQYRGGRKEVQIRANEVTSVELPIHLADQLIGDGNDALARNDLDKAKLFYERANRVQRGPGNRAAVALGLARTIEKKSGLKEDAVEAYNNALNIPEKDRTPETNLILQRELARIAPKVARVRTFSIGLTGKCEPKETIYLPGVKILNQGKGQAERRMFQPGQISEEKQCGN